MRRSIIGGRASDRRRRRPAGRCEMDAAAILAASFFSTAPHVPHAHRPHPAGEPAVRGADGGRHRPAVPPAVQAPRRGLCGERDGDLAQGPVDSAEDLAPRQPRRRGRADRGADRRHRRGHDGRGRGLQHRARRADHRHQHGLPGQEGLQQVGRLGADAGRDAGAGDRRGGGRRLRAARRAGHAEDAHRLVRDRAQRGAHGARRRKRRHRDAHRARPHARAGLQGRGRVRHDRRGEGRGAHSGGRQRRHRHARRRRATCWQRPAPTPS